MLTGRQAFPGETISDSLAANLKRGDPNLGAGGRRPNNRWVGQGAGGAAEATKWNQPT